MSAVALIPCAGIGERFGASVPKPLVDLCGKPVIAHTLAVFEAAPEVAEVILIVHPNHIRDYEEVLRRYPATKVKAVVPGGASRTCSVRNGLKALKSQADFVIIHDGVRPLVTVDIIARGLRSVREDQAVVAAVPVKPTLKVVDPKTGVVRETLDRTIVREIQTPQIFERSLLERAYAADVDETDDAALVERLGVSVKVFPGDYRNIKITTPEDLTIAEAFMKEK